MYDPYPPSFYLHMCLKACQFSTNKSHKARAVECLKLWMSCLWSQIEGLLRQNANISGNTVQRGTWKITSCLKIQEMSFYVSRFGDIVCGAYFWRVDGKQKECCSANLLCSWLTYPPLGHGKQKTKKLQTTRHLRPFEIGVHGVGSLGRAMEPLS